MTSITADAEDGIKMAVTKEAVELQSEFHCDVYLEDTPIWLAYEIGSVNEGQYAGTSILALGNNIAFNIQKDGSKLSSVAMSVHDLMAIALVATQKAQNAG